MEAPPPTQTKKESLRTFRRRAVVYALDNGLLDNDARIALNPTEVLAYVQAIHNKQSASFGLVKLSKFQLNVMIHVHSLPDGQVSCPGEQSSRPCNLLEYASMMGRDAIATSLVFAAVNAMYPRSGQVFDSVLPFLRGQPEAVQAWLLHHIIKMTRPATTNDSNVHSNNSSSNNTRECHQNTAVEMTLFNGSVSLARDEQNTPAQFQLNGDIVLWDSCGHRSSLSSVWHRVIEREGELSCPACGGRLQEDLDALALISLDAPDEWSQLNNDSRVPSSDISTQQRVKASSKFRWDDFVLTFSTNILSVVDDRNMGKNIEDENQTARTQKNKNKKKKPNRSKKQKVALRLPQAAQANQFLGSTPAQRLDKWWQCQQDSEYGQVMSRMRVAAIIRAGIDVDTRNEYGQTALFVACWRGRLDLVELLVCEAGADTSIPCHLGLTAWTVALARGDKQILNVLQLNSDLSIPCNKEMLSVWGSDVSPLTSSSDIKVETLISRDVNHPGAGSFMFDNCFKAAWLESLRSLLRTIPVANNTKTSMSIASSFANSHINISESCSTRRYLCDAIGHIHTYMEDAITRHLNGSRITFRNPTTDVCDSNGNGLISVGGGCEFMKSQDKSGVLRVKHCHVFPCMRLLSYEFPDSHLPPHVDLSRTNEHGQMSTHTFMLYLEDCDVGGETALLVRQPPRSSAQNQTPLDLVLHAVVPRFGRLLLFPHVCPHEGRTTVSVPKSFLRGEVLLELG